ncbi:MAG: AraC family transcriptional regulator [Clostridia bacterium]|nr:AraC family transcriptional regulator [Clostridia bacterium]
MTVDKIKQKRVKNKTDFIMIDFFTFMCYYVFMKKYYTYTVKKIITVQHLVTIEYLHVGKNFFYPEESHPFYEFVYVETGNITCKMKNENVDLRMHDFFLIPPDSPHSYCVEDAEETTIMVVCFKSKSNILSIIKGAQHLNSDIRESIKKILAEAKTTFIFPFDKKLTLNSHPRLGSQQLVENYIEEVLIKLVQSITYNNQNFQIATDSFDTKNSIAKEIVCLLEKNIYEKITLSDICNHMFYSKTYLNAIFKEIKGITIMQYYQELKINEAKMLLDKKESITSISEKLCFESPQYFTKVFKSKTGKSPTSYRLLTKSDVE